MSELEEKLDKILEKISLIFGTDSVDMVLPENMLVDLTLFRIANIDRNDLEGEAVLQAKMYMLFSSLLSFVVKKNLLYDATVKSLQSELSLEYEHLLNAKDKKLVERVGSRISDKKIAQLVESDARMTEAVSNRITYEHMVIAFKNMVNSLDKRADMLIQLISKRKRENERGVS